MPGSLKIHSEECSSILWLLIRHLLGRMLGPLNKTEIIRPGPSPQGGHKQPTRNVENKGRLHKIIQEEKCQGSQECSK